MIVAGQDIVRTARAAPRLTNDAEGSLAKAWKDRADTGARETLFRSNLRLVIHAAGRLRSFSSRYDPDAGARLATYAPVWIRAQMNEFIRRSTNVVCLPGSAEFKRASAGIARAMTKTDCCSTDRITRRDLSAISKEIGVPEHVACAVLNRNMGQVSLDARTGEDEGASLVSMLPCDAPTPAGAMERAQKDSWAERVVSNCLEGLSDRDRTIFRCRELTEEQTSLDDLAVRYGLSRQRINQIQHSVRGRFSVAARHHGAEARIHLNS